MIAPRLPCLPPKSPTYQPLHERRQVSLAIMPISYREWNTLYNNNYELILVMEEETEQDDQEYYTPPPSPDPSMIEESHLVEVIKGLYIAMVDDEAELPMLRTFDDESFTHVVQVSYVTPEDDSPTLLQWRRGETPSNALVEHLRLVCPVSDSQLLSKQTVVGPSELRAARDFLALALPYGGTKWWPEELRKDEEDNQSWRKKHDGQNERDDENDGDAQFVDLAHDYGLDDLLNKRCDRVEQDEDDKVNVLIVAPTCRAVDVLTILFCYLMFAEDITHKEIVDLNYLDEVWQKVDMGEWSMIYLSLIARCQ